MIDTIESVYSEATIHKAESLVANEYAVQRDAEDSSIWWVKGSGGNKYRVQVIEEFDEDQVTDGKLRPGTAQFEEGQEPSTGLAWLICSCPNGMNRGGRPKCYHTCAVLLILERGKADERPVMEDPNPLNEDFIPNSKDQALRDQGYSDDEIEFLRS